MPSSQKVEKVAKLKERVEGSQALLLAGYRGLTVVAARELRTSLRDADAQFTIVKNSLMKRAVSDAGLEGLSPLIDGPTAVAFVAGDPIAAAKRFEDAAKKFPALLLKGAWVEGRVLTAEEAKELAGLDSREAMFSKVAGMAKGEMSRAASMFGALQRRFLGLLEALQEKTPGDSPEGKE